MSLEARRSSLLLGALLLGSACTGPAPTPTGESRRETPTAETSAPGRPAPPWPTAPDTPPPSGFSWRTVHHETIHARFLMPDGGKVESTRDAHGYPRVNIAVDGETGIVQFDSGIGQLGATLAKTPPMVYSIPVEKAHVGPENLAARYRTRAGDLRITGHAPGVKCLFEPARGVPEATLDRIYTVCQSLRSPAPGPWRRATAAERAHGGMSDVPEGGWVEGALPTTPGSLLRPGKFIARLHLGGLVLSGSLCPPSTEALRSLEPNEAEVVVEERRTAGGDAWIRRATDTYGGDRYPGSSVVLARRGGSCCRAQLAPWTTPPSAAQIDYALALCDTFRAE